MNVFSGYHQTLIGKDIFYAPNLLEIYHIILHFLWHIEVWDITCIFHREQMGLNCINLRIGRNRAYESFKLYNIQSDLVDRFHSALKLTKSQNKPCEI